MPQPTQRPASGRLRVWITRAQPGAEATAARVRELGFDPLVAPLTQTRPLAFVKPGLARFAALAFTSATGVRAFHAAVGAPPLPVFAVGAATAAAAREAGFAQVADADGDGAALARLIAASPPAGPVLAPGAAEPAFDLPAALAAAGIEVQTLPLYATAPVTPPPADALAALATGELAAVLLHAPSATRALEDAAPAADLTPLLVLSPACAPFGLGWRVFIAAAPRERDLLALLHALDTPAPAR